MKEYQDLIGRIIIAASVIIAAFIIANAINTVGTNIGDQIISSSYIIARQIN